jgi:hypothetical protein
MAVPILTVLLLQPVLSLSAADLRWARVASVAWAVFYGLFAIDPTLPGRSRNPLPERTGRTSVLYVPRRAAPQWFIRYRTFPAIPSYAC